MTAEPFHQLGYLTQQDNFYRQLGSISILHRKAVANFTISSIDIRSLPPGRFHRQNDSLAIASGGHLPQTTARSGFWFKYVAQKPLSASLSVINYLFTTFSRNFVAITKQALCRMSRRRSSSTSIQQAWPASVAVSSFN